MTSAVARPAFGSLHADVCGKWMPRARESCIRRPGHNHECLSSKSAPFRERKTKPPLPAPRYQEGELLGQYIVTGVMRNPASTSPYLYTVRDERCGCERELHSCVHYEGFKGLKALCKCHKYRPHRSIRLDHYVAWVWHMPDDRLVVVQEHRIVMEQSLGRPLQVSEEVHHKNGVRNDNRLANLELWSTSQPAGQRAVDKVAWAKELLALYEPEALAHVVS